MTLSFQKHFLWLGFLLFPGVGFAAPAHQRAHDFSLRSRRSGSFWILTATPPLKHHINVQAPMVAEIGTRPIGAYEKTSHAAEFRIPERLGDSTVRVSLYLCDDANTVCERHTVRIVPAGKNPPVSAAPSGKARKPISSFAPKGLPTYGFILNDPVQAFAKARSENKPLIIDFFGIWCPPCNELDEKVFSSKEFSSLARKFVRLKLDADSPISWHLKSKYRVGGYPTVVFASANGDEISRIVGYRPKPEFLEIMSAAWKDRGVPLLKLEAKAAHGDRNAADRAGVILVQRGEYAKAIALLKGTAAKKEYLERAEIGVLKKANAPVQQRIQRIREAIRAFPRTPDTIEWYEDLAALEKRNKTAHDSDLKHAIGLGIALSKKPNLLKGYDAIPADLLEEEAWDREQLDGARKARPDWLSAAAAYAKRGLGARERGNNLEYLYCLGKAGEFAKARTIYARLEGAYPREFTFYYNHARMEREAKNYPEALKLAKTALSRSYGDNRLRVVLLLAQLDRETGKPARARQLIDETLKSVTVPADAWVRTHRYIDALKGFRAKLGLVKPS